MTINRNVNQSINLLLGIVFLCTVSSASSYSEEQVLSGKFVVYGTGPDPQPIADQRGYKIWRGAYINVAFRSEKQTNDGLLVRGASSLCSTTLRLYSVDGDAEKQVPASFRAVWPINDMAPWAYPEPEWCLLQDLKPGLYFVRVTLPPDSGALIPNESKLPFEILDPKTLYARSQARLSVIVALARLGELEEAEAGAFEFLQDFPSSPEGAYIWLAHIYFQAGLYDRAFEYEKEYLRSYYKVLAISDGPFWDSFAMKAVCAGSVTTYQDGIKQYDKMMRKLKNGEDTGKISPNLLCPILGKLDVPSSQRPVPSE